MRGSLIMLLLGACGHLPSPPPAGVETRHASATIDGLTTNPDVTITSDGAHTWVVLGERMAVVDWRDSSVTMGSAIPAMPRPDRPTISPDGRRRLTPAGDLVIEETVGAHVEGEGWHDGVTVARDAATGGERWRHAWGTTKDWPIAERIVAHGGELAFVYEQPPRAEIVRAADGKRLRTLALRDTWAGISDSVGFDGDTFWYFRYDAGHENPSDHMLGTPRRPDSPPACTYEIYDARHDRRKPLRTEREAIAHPRYCSTHAVIALPDGGVQVLTIERDGVLESSWLDRAP